MRSLKIWRTVLLVMLVTGLLAASELKGAPRLTINSPTGLYLLAQYKLAVGDKRSGLELLDRALACGESLPSRANTLVASGVCSCVANP